MSRPKMPMVPVAQLAKLRQQSRKARRKEMVEEARLAAIRPLNTCFAEALKAGRRSLGFSQRDMVAFLSDGDRGLRLRTYASWESGKREPLQVMKEGVVARIRAAIDSRLKTSGKQMHEALIPHAAPANLRDPARRG